MEHRIVIGNETYNKDLLSTSQNIHIGFDCLTPLRVKSNRACSQRPVQQGRRAVGARSVHEYVSTTTDRERRWRTLRPDSGHACSTGPAGNRLTGYTLLELMIVVAIASILVTLAVPSFQRSAVKAREATLKNNLATIRTVLDQHYADQGMYPQSLEALVEAGYLRHIPVDPFTKTADTWQLVFEENAGDDEAGGIFDVHSGSDLTAIDGSAYNEW